MKSPTLETVMSVIDQATLPPGWTAEAREVAGGMLRDPDIVITVASPPVPLVQNHERTAPLQHSVILRPEYFPEEEGIYIVDMIRHAIKYLLVHEVDEWMALDGKVLWPPHATSEAVASDAGTR